MPRKSRYTPVRRVPSPEDMNFIKSVARGENRNKAFRDSYPNHPKVARYMDIVSHRGAPPEEGEQRALGLAIRQIAKDKVQAKYISERLVSFQDSMDVLAAKSLLVANDLLDNGRSEKVKADLAVEFIRHKVGTPTVKVQQQVDKTVHLSFGTPASRDDFSDIIEAEVVDD